MRKRDLIFNWNKDLLLNFIQRNPPNKSLPKKKKKESKNFESLKRSSYPRGKEKFQIPKDPLTETESARGQLNDPRHSIIVDRLTTLSFPLLWTCEELPRQSAF